MHVEETTYRFFHAFEYVVKGNLTKPTAPSKVEVIQRPTDDDVQFYWLMVIVDCEMLLWKIVNYMLLYELANGWVEKYKQCTKQATQNEKPA